jgi:hypothetical protein
MSRRLALVLAILHVSFTPIAGFADNPADPVIRTVTGVRYTVPAGWEWRDFNGFSVTLEHAATKAGEAGKGTSPNRFSLGTRRTPNDAFERGWDRVDRADRRTFAGGATAKWKAGPRYGMHYAFAGEVMVGSRVLDVSILDTPTPKFDTRVVEAAFMAIAESAREVPEATAIYHPTLGVAGNRVPSADWYNSSNTAHLGYACFQSACGDGSNTWIFVYPSSIDFPDIATALADITGYFEKNTSLTIGPVQREEIPGGEITWTEQPGSPRPMLGVTRRDGRDFFVNMSVGEVMTRTHEAVRADFLTIARGVRGWDGK